MLILFSVIPVRFLLGVTRRFYLRLGGAAIRQFGRAIRIAVVNSSPSPKNFFTKKYQEIMAELSTHEVTQLLVALIARPKPPWLLVAPVGEETFENPVLSPDGRWLYFGVNNNEESVYLISFK